MNAYVFRAAGVDPYENLALEQLLLEQVGPSDCILYLWQNERTVVIGRNQIPWKECRLSLLEEDGGRLARRLSGGGAVYHDLGNLNFSFLAGSGVYDEARQTALLLRALRALGVPAERTGRNDLLADGRKFSGCAYLRKKDRACHHGTLMVDVDTARAERYLSPPAAKLTAKGVASVRARVVNLRELTPDLSCERLAEALTEAAAGEYGALSALPPPDGAALSALRARLASAAWLFPPDVRVDAACEGRFPWGGAELRLQLEGGRVQDCRVYTDAMDETLAARTEAALRGCVFTPAGVEAALGGLPQGRELCGLLRGCF